MAYTFTRSRYVLITIGLALLVCGVVGNLAIDKVRADAERPGRLPSHLTDWKNGFGWSMGIGALFIVLGLIGSELFQGLQRVAIKLQEYEERGRRKAEQRKQLRAQQQANAQMAQRSATMPPVPSPQAGWVAPEQRIVHVERRGTSPWTIIGWIFLVIIIIFIVAFLILLALVALGVMKLAGVF